MGNNYILDPILPEMVCNRSTIVLEKLFASSENGRFTRPSSFAFGRRLSFVFDSFNIMHCIRGCLCVCRFQEGDVFFPLCFKYPFFALKCFDHFSRCEKFQFELVQNLPFLFDIVMLALKKYPLDGSSRSTKHGKSKWKPIEVWDLVLMYARWCQYFILIVPFIQAVLKWNMITTGAGVHTGALSV